ncbi:MAG: isoprenoid biosynthesis protein with amidotransferase-like domain [Verrucomicrobiota bacterium]|jgi:enhancing lycopene biosynthesis protein 2
MYKKIGVILSGCGVYDGSEIHESVLTLLAIEQLGGEALIIAPDITQAKVVDHHTGALQPGSRSVLSEAARIARGPVLPVDRVKAQDLDALILPGGFGAALNLCDFASRGAACSADAATAKLIRDIHALRRPIGALCIAPAFLARVLGDQGVRLTIGDDPGTAAALEAMGAHHENAAADAIVHDEKHRLVTCPAYMKAKNLVELWSGVHRLVAKVVELA